MTQYVWRNQYEFVELDGEWIVLNTHDFTATKLNAVGGFCWQQLHTPQTRLSLLHTLQQSYEELSETVEDEIDAFLAELLECGLIVHAG